MISCIYAFINIVNDKHYVGQTNDKEGRFKEHVKCLNGYYHHNLHLQRSWCKHGKDAFIFMVLEYCPVELLNERETHWIKILNCLQPNGYNMAPTANSMKGYKHTDQARKNMSDAHKGKSHHTPEWLAELSERMKGNKHAAGTVQTAEHIEARSRVNRGRTMSDTHKAALLAAHLGRVTPPEVREKQSISAKKRWSRVDKTENSNFSSEMPAEWGDDTL